jgi:hypothetical protein
MRLASFWVVSYKLWKATLKFPSYLFFTLPDDETKLLRAVDSVRDVFGFTFLFRNFSIQLPFQRLA